MLFRSTSDLQAIIKDASGQVVKKADLGAASAGDTDFIWDGSTDAGTLAPNGHYQIQFMAANSGEAAAQASSYVGSMVASVGQDATGILLGLGDGRQAKSTDILKWVGF